MTLKSSAQDQSTVILSNAIVPTMSTKKQKKESLDGYVDHPLTKEQSTQANVHLLQWFIHANIPFLAVDDVFFHYFLNTIRPSYKAPSHYVVLHQLLDSEAVCVQQEDINQLKSCKRLTLLLDGWEDLLKCSLYDSVAVEKALRKMEIDDGKNIIAVTTDNPAVMQAYHHKFQEKYPWVLPFTCFLHSLNTLIGDIVTYPVMKKTITQTTQIVSFFNASHYWGGQLNDKSRKLDIKQRLKQNCESHFYALILHFLSVVSHKNPLFQICIHPDAQRKVNNQTAVAADIINTVLYDCFYWQWLEQLIKTTKPIIDAIGNTESRQTSLADCMLELICCAKQMSNLQLDPDDDAGFWMHAKNTFNRRFHAINTDYHLLALFLHQICRELAIIQAANGWSIEFMIKIALQVAQRLRWNSQKAGKLVDDMQTYNLSHAPFAGGQANGLIWWEDLPISGDTHPLKILTIRMLSIVPHAGDVEHLFSDLGRKIHANLRHHIHLKDIAMQKEPCHRHAHMHVRKEPSINVNIVEDLNETFTWLPPLSAISEKLFLLTMLMQNLTHLNDKRWESNLRGWTAGKFLKEILLAFVLLNSLPKLPEWNMFTSSIINTIEDRKLTFHTMETKITSEEAHLNPSGYSDSALKVSTKSSAHLPNSATWSLDKGVEERRRRRKIWEKKKEKANAAEDSLEVAPKTQEIANIVTEGASKALMACILAHLSSEPKASGRDTIIIDSGATSHMVPH
ncbi:hypothetical protein PAXRUDRAFT_17058 [Paxillus rubicundulus Ve08.2h10]|uniref:DUF659 domain-containing protein n=1 Tax=Paxillus rubicundulus Ve08.2h10 TaxID=930991 RepID=A0A0D0CRU9_9AGAM|nr:hypothetical protein PAXRUDRAFT_17058 [Paxillus rubicundulus Ve08.2h10]